MGRQTARILTDGDRETFTHEATGKRAIRTDFKGATTVYAYDQVGRLLSREYPDPLCTGELSL